MHDDAYIIVVAEHFRKRSMSTLIPNFWAKLPPNMVSLLFYLCKRERQEQWWREPGGKCDFHSYNLSNSSVAAVFADYDGSPISESKQKTFLVFKLCV